MNEFQPRAGQRQVLAYTGGRMGISAVPGAGKTRTLAELAAQLVVTGIQDDQEILVVTLVNSAVDNFRRRINNSIGSRGLVLNLGYRVRTLHGLAHDIVRERPALVGLAEDFAILDERQAEAALDSAVEAWLRAHPAAPEPYLSPELQGDRIDWVRREQWPKLARSIAAAFVKHAKDLQLTPELLAEQIRRREGASATGDGLPELPLARMGAEIYADYQRSLTYRGAVDFADLVRLALVCLQRDDAYLARLQHRWPFVLEDEAQDSSALQERILRLLVGDDGNWVRVGDTNQAIYKTFTNADPKYLRQFMKEPGVQKVPLEESGRSQPAIIALANHLVDWTKTEYKGQPLEEAFDSTFIRPTEPGDSQPNPPNDPSGIMLVEQGFSPEAELHAVAKSLKSWLPEHPQNTVAVLVPRNERGFELLDLLRKQQIEYVELLKSTSATRHTAGALGNLLHSLADPTSSRKLSIAFRVWRRTDRNDTQGRGLMEAAAKQIASCSAVEAYLWPRADHDWLTALDPDLPAEERALLAEFRPVACRWLRAASLPPDQLVLTLAGDLFWKPSELALAYKLALLLRDVVTAHPNFRLPELVQELESIARNERRYLGFDEQDSGFEPPAGKVTVATIHKAKGLEWDRVYLLSVNNYDFPFGGENDRYIAEKWFVRDDLNLEAEALAQLDLLAVKAPEAAHWSADGGKQARANGRSAKAEGAASDLARLDYVAERLRLLYVGITRARRELIITWNSGRSERARLQPTAGLVALQDFWRGTAGANTDSDHAAA